MDLDISLFFSTNLYVCVPKECSRFLRPHSPFCGSSWKVDLGGEFPELELSAGTLSFSIACFDSGAPD